MYEIESYLLYQEVQSNSAEVETAPNRQEANRSRLEEKLVNKKNINISITQDYIRLNHSFQGGFLQAKYFLFHKMSKKPKGMGEKNLANERDLSSGRD